MTLPEMPGWPVTAIQGCPCGQLHMMDPHSKLAYDIITAGRPSEIPIVSEFGTWNVSKVYLGCHGLLPEELPSLAEQYGWLRA